MPTARFPKAFLSCSLSEQDRSVATWFADVLQALEFEVLAGDMPEPRGPAEKVLDMIRGSDVVVAILMRRDKIEGKDAWRPPEWVENEMGMAYEAAKPVAIFVEEGVDVAGLGPLISQYERCDRRNLAESVPRIVRYLVTLRHSFLGD